MSDPIHVEELATYLGCPRQYEFKYVSEFAGDEQWDQNAFRQLLRDSICTGLANGLDSGKEPREVAEARLDSRWDTYAGDINHHSERQVSTERSRAEAAIDAYFESVGQNHLDGIDRAQDLCDIPVVGPAITLSAPFNGQTVAADVDYIMVVSDRVVGVRLTERLWGCWVPWESDTEVVSEHFDQGEYKHRQVGTVFAARVVEEALSRFGGEATGAELQYLSVMEQTFETSEAFVAELDERWMGDYLEESRGVVDDAIGWLCANLGKEVFSPEALFDEQEYWNGSFETVVENECRRCCYSSGCQDRIRRDVMFNV